MEYVKPIQIMSPYSGVMVKPKLREKDYGDKIVVEAWWYCPSSGEFMQKGIVSEHPKAKDGQK